MSKLILVSNRIPWTLQVKRGLAELLPSSGGLATALAGTHARGGTLWVGWPGDTTGLSQARKDAAFLELAHRRVVPVELARAEVERYYEGFSNGVLWPLFHYLLDKVRLDADRDWEAYRTVNERFAEAVLREAEDGDTVWVHDYQLMLLPELLRERRPGLRIGFFLHIPFPAAEVFRILPWRERLLAGLLGADLVGFHTQAYRNHFAGAAAQVLGADAAPGGLRYGGRFVRTGAFGIGIDAEVFRAAAEDPAVQDRVADLRREAGDRALLLGIDRLDYTKGIPRRLLAIERLLERHPELKERFLYLQVAVPSRERVEAYAQYRRTVDELVGRINGAYGSPTRLPVHLLHQSVPFEELVALYRAADVMIVTPLRDGMNLVAKEYCATRVDDGGVLILSEFAGAAASLREALLVNPYDIGGMAEAIRRALAMPGAERSSRMRALRRRVAGQDVHRWASAFLEALGQDEGPEAPSEGPGPLLDRILDDVSRSRRVVLFLDYDGTLVPFAPRPEGAVPDPALQAMLARLSTLPGVEVHLVSGRSREDLEGWFGGLDLRLHAEHGAWRRPGPGSPWQAVDADDHGWKTEAIRLIEGWCARIEGSFLEEKATTLAWHHRLAESTDPEATVEAAQEDLTRFAERNGLELLQGAKVLELRRPGSTKALAVDPSVAEPGVLAIALGDDRTDEDLFGALPPSGLSIRVGQGPSRAGFRLGSVAEVRILLHGLAERLPGRLEAQP